ncbi:interferon-related developmental regulator 1-like protein [Lasius niger]|uniref:Interferon-related developmental regulator 1-like protein n=1 Tax=Lasius niger TaxID=67767 RepID=A0A0J7JXH3_LASNI|nr:interferon-related developmental regulator 1-like protein [Lasius niger]
MYAFAREQTADEVSKGFCSQLNASALPIFERKNFLLKERCTKNGGPGAFENVQRAEMDMKQCLQSPINITNVRAEIKKYKSIGNLVVTFKNYCNERFIKRSCSDNYTDAMKHYLTKTELEKERL